jgi:hypothetical protein
LSVPAVRPAVNVVVDEICDWAACRTVGMLVAVDDATAVATARRYTRFVADKAEVATSVPAVRRVILPVLATVEVATRDAEPDLVPVVSSRTVAVAAIWDFAAWATRAPAATAEVATAWADAECAALAVAVIVATDPSTEAVAWTTRGPATSEDRAVMVEAARCVTTPVLSSVAPATTAAEAPTVLFTAAVSVAVAVSAARAMRAVRPVAVSVATEGTLAAAFRYTFCVAVNVAADRAVDRAARATLPVAVSVATDEMNAPPAGSAKALPDSDDTAASEAEVRCDTLATGVAEETAARSADARFAALPVAERVA